MRDDQSNRDEPITQWVRDLNDPAKFQDSARKLWDKYHRHLQWRIRHQIADQCSRRNVAGFAGGRYRPAATGRAVAGA